MSSFYSWEINVAGDDAGHYSQRFGFDLLLAAWNESCFWY